MNKHWQGFSKKKIHEPYWTAVLPSSSFHFDIQVVFYLILYRCTHGWLLCRPSHQIPTADTPHSPIVWTVWKGVTKVEILQCYSINKGTEFKIWANYVYNSNTNIESYHCAKPQYFNPTWRGLESTNMDLMAKITSSLMSVPSLLPHLIDSTSIAVIRMGLYWFIVVNTLSCMNERLAHL